MPNQSPAVSGNTMHSGNSEARSTTSNFNHTLISGLTPNQACPIPLTNIPPVPEACLSSRICCSYLAMGALTSTMALELPGLSTLVLCGKCMEAE